MKIAVICDWLVTYAGSERALAEILHCYPNADLFSVIDFLPSEIREKYFNNKKSQTTFIQKFPFAKKLYRAYLPWMPLAIEQLDVSQYDLIISNSHAVAKGIITHANQIHIGYVHSPMRYAWDLQHQYLQDSGLNKGIKGYFAKKLLHKMRLWDLRTANGVDHFLGNSQHIVRRIWRVYRREADVLYPPVDTSQFKLHTQKEDFYLTASRFVPYKKIDLIVEAFAEMPDKKLLVIGDGPDYKKIKAKAKKNIELLGYQPTEKMMHYMQRAKAFVFAAEEDFGIVPLEAQACGTPVIAYARGGLAETICGLDHEKPTGVFFQEQSSHHIKNAVTEFENNQSKINPEDCSQNAARFAVERFRENLMGFVSRITAQATYVSDDFLDPKERNPQHETRDPFEGWKE